MTTSIRSALLRRAAATVVMTGALTGLTATPALAHDELISSTPEDGAVLDTAPEQVVLTYTAEPMDMGSQVRVTDSTGESVTAGDLDIDGTRVIQPLANTGTEDETYRVIWRVVSSDGHPIEGTFTYQVGDGAPEPSAPISASSDAPAAQQSTSASQQSMPMWAVGAIGAALALGMAGLAILVRKRRHN